MKIKKSAKKIISFILITVFILSSLLSIPVSAADSYRNVTRSEIALVIAELSTGMPEYFQVDPDANGAELLEGLNLLFEDIDPERDKIYLTAIDFCLKEDIISGRNDTEYDPLGPITLIEAVTFMLRSLNYAGLLYPDGYIDTAWEAGLLKENLADVDLNKILTWDIFIILIRNYLTCGKVTVALIVNPETGAMEMEREFIPIIDMLSVDADTYMAKFDIYLSDTDTDEEVPEDSEEENKKEEENNDEKVPEPEGPVNAQASQQKVIFNDENVDFDAYNINGNNYIKLRDLAFILNGTEKQFGVDYDSDTNTILLTSNAPYIPNGSEMAEKDEKAKIDNIVLSPQKITLDGKDVSFTAYNINGNNYFKLRDVMKTFDVYVGYDDETRTVTLDTSKGYVD